MNLVTNAVVGTALALLLSGGAGAAPPEHSYVGVRKCKSCHGKELYGDQVSVWRAGPHAKAFESLSSDKAHEYAREAGIAGPPNQAAKCRKCHVTAEGVSDAFRKYALLETDGIQCESCHGPGADYRKKSIMSDADKASAKGLVKQTAEVCTTCHNDESPAWDPRRYALAGGGHAGFDFDQARAKIQHPIPPDNKGHVVEIEKARRKARKKAR